VRGGLSGLALALPADNEINRQFPCRLFPQCYPEWAPVLDRTKIRPRVTGGFACQGNCWRHRCTYLWLHKAFVEVPADGEYQLRGRSRSVSISRAHGLQHSDPAFEIGADGIRPKG
jgi:hypothetical protein